MCKFMFMSLPTEIIIEIYKEMEGIDVVRARQLCRRMSEIWTERSIWARLLANYRPRLAGPVDNYSTLELQNHVFRQISTDLAWRSNGQLVERCASGGLEIGDRGNILLEGGRWLLTFGDNLFEPTGRKNVYAYDLDSSNTSMYIIYQLDLANSFKVEYVTSQVDADNDDLTFNIAVKSQSPREPWSIIQVIQMKQQGQGRDAKPVISPLFPPLAVGNRSIEKALCLQGDLIALASLHSIRIINWRTTTVTSTYETALFDVSIGAGFKAQPNGIRLLPGNKILFLFTEQDTVALYKISDLRRRHSTDRVPVHEYGSLQLLWKTQIDSYPGLKNSEINFSEPYHIGSAMRLTLRIGDEIYGIIIPDNGFWPTFFLLATSPKLMDVRRTIVKLGITRLLIAPWSDLGPCNASTLAFTWPNDEREASKWQPPVLPCLPRYFEAFDYTRDNSSNILELDDASGRILITGPAHNPNARHEIRRIIDFCEPQFLPAAH